jgi:hypothetical protein
MLIARRNLFRLHLAALAAAGGALLALAGCETPAPGNRFPELGYSHLPQLSLAVGRIDIVQEYRPPSQPPNVEHMFPVRPAAAAERWARDRLKAAGGPGELRVVIVRAAVVEVPLKQSGGIRGAFTNEQAERYDGEMEMRLELTAPEASGTVSARAERRRTVPEDISLADREKVWFQLTEAMMNDLNESLERQVKKNFANWLR